MKPHRREAYWMLDRYFQPCMRIWYGNEFEKKYWAIGNVFSSRREAAEVAKKFHKILKKHK
jgi:hypothetical protein